MNEIWKDCIGYEKFYQVSNFGRIRRSAIGQGTFIGRILNPKSMKDDYLRVTISINGYRKVEKIHLLVSRAFFGPRPPGYQVNHKDGNKHNNCVENLEYVTHSENAKHAIKYGLMKVPGLKGSKNAQSKLDEFDVQEIRCLYATGKYTQLELSKKFSVKRRQIGNIINRKNWSHI